MSSKRPTDSEESEAKKSKNANGDNSYGWEQVHADVESGHVAGSFGGSNATYWGLASVRAGVNMKDWHKKRSPDERYLPELDAHIRKPSTQAHWRPIFTFDPLGMYSGPPTIAATTAHMEIPEIQKKLVRDGVVVRDDGSINIVKAGIDYTWNLPMMAEVLKMDETAMRGALQEYTQNKKVTDPQFRTFLPPVNGLTVYFIGDISKLSDPTTPVAVRVHDACCGSDCFGTDICTCRPYLVFAIQACVECAQAGGVGLICYFAKEGRSLGEVTKFRVYNARRSQEGGDRPEKYFYHTESIAGVRDARFQEMMPDVLLWLGIKRIDFLLSMSSDKYGAITAAGIEVMQRVELPDEWVPPAANVELKAKISAGYHTDHVDEAQIVNQHRQLEFIRKRCGIVFGRVKEGRGRHFNLDLTKLPEVVDFVAQVAKTNYPDIHAIPYHSRWRHFSEDALNELLAKLPKDPVEQARRKVDLITISVLMDAGAGNVWRYITETGQELGHSEGLAAASLDMFNEGVFSSDTAVPHRVNSHGLRALELKELHRGLRVHDQKNPIVGLEGRFGLLKALADALDSNPKFFGKEVPRPGRIVDWVLQHVKDGRVSIQVLWQAVIEGFEGIWPANMSGVRRGDVAVYSPMKEIGHPGSDMIPFHKLSQWLTYSLLEPLEALGIKFDDLDLLTALAGYRDGGLFVDFGVLALKDPNGYKLTYDTGSELIVEWRALTVILVDMAAVALREKLGLTAEELPLAKVLQAGTWQAGRAIAAQKRADRSSPIAVRSDGTVF